MLTPRSMLVQALALAAAAASVSGRIASREPIISCLCAADANAGSVCGADGNTYATKCAAGCAGTTVDHDGDCNIIEDRYLCTADWKPICGSDGNTYSNDCNLSLAKGVTKKYDGECKAEQTPEDPEPVPEGPPAVPEPQPRPDCCGSGKRCCKGRCQASYYASFSRCADSNPKDCCQTTN